MGMCLSPDFNIDIPEAQYDGDGKGIARAGHILVRVAVTNGLTPLMSFLGYAEDAGDFEEVPGGEDQLEDLPPSVLLDEWYDSGEGLRTVSGLIRALETDGQSAKLVNKLATLSITCWRS